LDSLWRIVRTSSEGDTSHIQALLSISISCIDKEPGKALSCADAALRASESIGYKKGAAKASLWFGNYYLKKHQLDSAEHYFKRGLAFYEELHWALGLGNSHNFLGIVHSLRGEHNRAAVEYKSAAEMYESVGNLEGVAHALSNSGISYHDQGIIDSAAAVFERALRIYEGFGNKGDMATSYINLANCVRDDSISYLYFQRALDLFNEDGNTRGALKALYHLGLVALKFQDKESARRTLTRAMETAGVVDDPEILAGALNQLGKLDMEIGDGAAAARQFEEALRIAKATGQMRISSVINFNLANLYAGAKNFADAVQHAEKAVEAARAVNDRAYEQEALSLLSRLEEYMGYYASALAHHRAAAALRDSIYSEKSSKHILDLLAKYEADKREKDLRLLQADRKLKEAELARRVLELSQQSQRLALLAKERDLQRSVAERARTGLELQKQIARNRSRQAALLARENQLQRSNLEREQLLRNSILGGLVLLAVASFFGYKRLRGLKREASLRAEAAEYKARAAEAQSLALAAETEKREKQAQQEFSRRLMELQEEERKRISAELHDGLSQELIVIKNHAMLAIKANGDKKAASAHIDEVMSMAASALTDVRQISRALHPYQIDQVGLSETLRGTLRKVIESSPLQIEAEIGDIDNLLSIQDEIILFRLVQESVNNILRHADATEARIRAVCENETILLTVSDNGRGFDPSTPVAQNSTGGLGLRSMRERVRMLGGEFVFDTAPGLGTRIEIRIPAGGMMNNE